MYAEIITGPVVVNMKEFKFKSLSFKAFEICGILLIAVVSLVPFWNYYYILFFITFVVLSESFIEFLSKLFFPHSVSYHIIMMFYSNKNC